MCRQNKLISSSLQISCHQLRWKHSDPDHELLHILTLHDQDQLNSSMQQNQSLPPALFDNSSNETTKLSTNLNSDLLATPILPPLPPSPSNLQLFDRIIACDCMFFKEYHTDLVWILFNSLSPNGVVYMFQPKRGNTMELFLNHAKQYFNITIEEFYNKKITELHEEYLQTSTVYDPDIHYPFLVILTKFQEL